MPRKQKVKEPTDTKKSKKNLLNTIVKNVNSKDEHIILQLPLTQHHIEKIVNNTYNTDYVPVPFPYERNCCFLNDEQNDVNNEVKDDNDIIENTDNVIHDSHNNQCCFWCCHPIEYKIYGMPTNYDSINDSYVIYGAFCSLQCANAHNFSSHNGSDKVWEINSMIQMLARRYGISNFIRPAPSKFLLKMFNGYLTIEEFRNLHKNNETSHVLNLPPMISIPSGYEVVNTSYVKKNSEC